MGKDHILGGMEKKRRSKTECEISARLKGQCERSNLVLKGIQVILGVIRTKTRRKRDLGLRRALNSRDRGARLIGNGRHVKCSYKKYFND